ncbi:HAD family hydrolase [Roseovarius sp. C7]|uniref:HAD family hydrolase n=1 Tax=Roseovarius sp. C7 TaxID=3398643 RepID=UPI0039F6D273
MISAVLFDIGNVLIRWAPEVHYDRRIGPDRRRAFFAAYDFYDLMNRIDAGAHFHDTITDAAAATPDWADELAILRDEWAELATPAIDHSVRLLEALKANGTPVFALSNFGAENFPLSVATFPFLDLFDRRYISGDMKLAKPDPAIYAAVETDCGLPPEALLFADDREDNIAAAAARGWQTHLFTTPQGWADRLVQHGLLTKEQAQ